MIEETPSIWSIVHLSNHFKMKSNGIAWNYAKEKSLGMNLMKFTWEFTPSHHIRSVYTVKLNKFDKFQNVFPLDLKMPLLRAITGAVIVPVSNAKSPTKNSIKIL